MIPKPGLTTLAKVARVIDGDTVEVEVTRRFKIRVLDSDDKGQFNMPELNTLEGQEAKLFLLNLLKDKEVTVFIPSHNPQELVDINSFNRLLGEIWLDGVKVSDIMKDKFSSI